MSAASSELRKAVGETIRALRKRAGLAQERLALEAGIDRSYMSGLERGQHTPSLEMILRLLPPLEVTLVGFALELEDALRRIANRRSRSAK